MKFKCVWLLFFFMFTCAAQIKADVQSIEVIKQSTDMCSEAMIQAGKCRFDELLGDFSFGMVALFLLSGITLVILAVSKYKNY